MTQRRREFEQFIRRVHRRYAVLRVLENTALGVLGGCAAVAPLLAIALWRGYPSLSLAVVALTGGAAAGLLWGLMTRPTLLSAAMEADRQLEWADLLSSALTTRRANGDPWVAAMAAAADARCRRTAPSSVILNRLGARAWGGIGLATALVIVLGLLPTYAAPTRAGDSAADSRDLLASAQLAESQNPMRSTLPARRTPREQEPAESDASRLGHDGPDSQQQARNSETAGNDSARRQAESSDPNGHGTGASHSDVRDPGSLSSSPNGTHARAVRNSGEASVGVGESSSDQLAARGSSTGSAGSTSPKVSVPPWSSSQWPQRAQHARQLLDSGQVPDAYRDLVREYFDRAQ